jgi:hypothetical protein
MLALLKTILVTYNTGELKRCHEAATANIKIRATPWHQIPTICSIRMMVRCWKSRSRSIVREPLCIHGETIAGSEPNPRVIPIKGSRLRCFSCVFCCSSCSSLWVAVVQQMSIWYRCFANLRKHLLQTIICDVNSQTLDCNLTKRKIFSTQMVVKVDWQATC